MIGQQNINSDEPMYALAHDHNRSIKETLFEVILISNYENEFCHYHLCYRLFADLRQNVDSLPM